MPDTPHGRGPLYGDPEEADSPPGHFAPFIIEPGQERPGIAGTDFLDFLIRSTLDNIPQPMPRRLHVNLLAWRSPRETLDALYNDWERRWALADRSYHTLCQ